MANVKGKEVSDGTHNVLYKSAGVGEVPAVIVENVSEGENVRYKLAGAGEVPNVLVNFEGVTMLTIDSTAYTADSTLITADQTEA